MQDTKDQQDKQMCASHLYALNIRRKTVHCQGPRGHMLGSPSIRELVCNQAHILAIPMACAVRPPDPARGHEAKCCSK
jgi:hypothetical protein